jgi:hypothetical protein
VNITTETGHEAPDLAVVYLNRAKSKVEEASRERFIRAYQRLIPEVRHVLYVVNKGFAAEELEVQYELFRALQPRFIDVDDEGFDLEAYRKAARQIEEPIVFFMNTHSEPLQHGWLDKVYTCFTSSDNIGLAGCTGNVETHHLPDFPAYPNFHVRSNAFMLSRKDYLKMLGDRPVDSKVQAYQIEAGRQSLTRLIQASGRKAVVVGKLGVVQKGTLWRASIFRSGWQQNLLLADNQTRLYQQASLITKLMMWSLNYSLLFRLLLFSSGLRKLLLWLFPQKIKWLILKVWHKILNGRAI